MRILNFLRKIRNFVKNSPNTHLLRIEIDSQKLLSNIAILKQKFPKHQLSIVLKGNAYGHGLKEMADFLDLNQDITYFCVDVS